MISKPTPPSILKQLIAIPSQNPMGHEPSGEGWFEAGMSDWLQQFFQTHSIPCEYHQIEPGRGNVVALIKGDPSRPTILLDAHQDTVPVAGMTIEPFNPVETDGRLYGRGASDVKGSMAAILSAAIEVTQSDTPHASVLISLTCDEERSQKGAAELVRRFNMPVADRSPLMQQMPTAAIVFEPTDLNVVVAHKGAVRWKIRTHGIAAHSSDPSKGSNAIYGMAKVLNALERYAAEIQRSGITHPLCGSRTLSVGTVQGGASVNIVPEQCTIEIDRRLVPGENAEDAIADVRAYLERERDVDCQFLPVDTASKPLTDTNNALLCNQILEATRPTIADRQAIGVRFGTHAPRIASLDIPTVVFGPGSIDQAHTKDEWIEIEQLHQAAEIIVRYIQHVV